MCSRSQEPLSPGGLFPVTLDSFVDSDGSFILLVLLFFDAIIGMASGVGFGQPCDGWRLSPREAAESRGP